MIDSDYRRGWNEAIRMVSRFIEHEKTCEHSMEVHALIEKLAAEVAGLHKKPPAFGRAKVLRKG